MAIFDRDRALALDLGASKIVLAEFSVARGEPVLLKYGIAPLEGDAGSDSDRLAYIVTAIRDLMREQGICPAPLLMAVSGQAVFPRFVKLPAVDKDKLNQIIEYEAELNVPFPMNEVVWDYQLIGGDEGEHNVMLVAAKIENIKRLTDCVQAVDLEPEIVDVSPMAIFNAVRYNLPELDGCTMVLDIGARSSNLIFIEQNRIFSRSIPVAGNAITQELMKEFDVSFSKAESIKREHGFVAFGGVYAGADDETAERASKIVRSVLTRLHAEVNRSVNFYRSQQGGSPPDSVLLVGGSSMIPHVDTFFQDKLKVPVSYFNPFERVAVSPDLDVDRVNADLQNLSEVVGLILRKLERCPVEINLMPPALVALKVFRRRKPFFALSVVGVMLTMLCWWGYFFRMRVATEAQLREVRQEIAGFVQTQNKFTEAGSMREAAAGKLQTIFNLVESRTEWIALLGAVRSAMEEGMWITAVKPSLGGSRLSEIEITVQAFADRLEDTEQGTATERFRNRLRTTPYFTEQTAIISEMAIGAYLRRFSIRLHLTQPIDIR